MFYLTLLIPILTAAVIFLFYRDKALWWEYMVLFAVSAFSYAVTTMIMYESNIRDTEYWGSLGVKVRYYEHWDEYIQKTCSYESCSGSGKDQTCTTVYYDCSYVDDHPEYWVLISDSGLEYEISESYYDELRQKWNAKAEFVEMSRNYHRIDGDAYDYRWDAREVTAQGIVTVHSYDNKTQAANTIFKFKDMEPAEAREKGLFDYPKLSAGFIQPTILGASVHDSTRRKFDYLNATLGSNKEVKIFILYFWNKSRNVATEQKNYWKGGNKNELVICVGVDKATKKVNWVESFSWCKIPAVESKISAWYAQNQHFNLDRFQPVLQSLIYSEWHRRDFADFDYIEIELSESQVIWTWVILSILCILASVWVVKNGIE